MQFLVSTTWLCVASFFFWLEMSSSAAAAPEVMNRPTRPKVFTHPDQLKSYLDQLMDSYAIAGRPRFGKRNLPRWSPDYSNDLYEENPLTMAELLQLLSSSNN